MHQRLQIKTCCSSYNTNRISFDSMHPQLPEHAVVTLLKQCFITPRCQISPNSHFPRSIRRSRILPHARRRNRTILEEQQRCYNTNTQSRRTGNETQAHTTPSSTATRAYKSDLAAKKQTDIEDDDVTRIAVLGGGITGLASAHYLARELPNAKITVYEASDRVGGWLRTTELGDEGGKVYFEQGPRTLRPGNAFGCAGLTTLELV